MQVARSSYEGEPRAAAESTTGTPKLSVIVPVRNGERFLGRCLDALRLSDFEPIEILVVDDASTDTTSEIAAKYAVRYVSSASKKGPANARNVGAQHAKGDILVFVDADVLLPPNGLRLIADTFENKPDISAVFGSYDDSPDCPAFFSQYKNLVHHYIHQASRETASTFWAGCGAMRKCIFEQFGGFDATRYTQATIEDVALGVEVTRAGYRILLDKRLIVKHLKSWTFLSLVRTDIFHRAVPWTHLILSTRSLPSDLNFDTSSRVSLLLIAALTGLAGLGALSTPQLWLQIRIPIFAVAAASASLLLFINRRLYSFFAKKRGAWFAARAVLAHWFYFLYGGLTLVVVSLNHWIFGSFRRSRPSVHATASIKRDISQCRGTNDCPRPGG
jgi:glycosyltransferase involved in cell wall biosynthesis